MVGKKDDIGKNIYLSASETAKRWQVSQRSVRNYCAQGRVKGALLKGKTWLIPKTSSKPVRLGSAKEKAESLQEEDFLGGKPCAGRGGAGNSGFNYSFEEKRFQTNKKASSIESIRDVIRYLKKFKNATIVIHFNDKLIDSSLFSSHIKDIALMHEAGLNVIIVPGAKLRIDQVLTDANIFWEEKNGLRVTSENAMPLIKMAAFDVSNRIMTSLSGHGITALIGNWVRSRSKGIINGFDFGTCGEIEKISVEDVKKIITDGFIPIFPCIGWSASGKPYNISSIKLASEMAVALNAEKLFFLTPSFNINCEEFSVPVDLPLSPDGTIPALNLEELDEFLNANKIDENSENYKINIISLLKAAKKACIRGVNRVHILDGSLDGSMPCEIFSGLGSGTMIYQNDYGGIREMKLDDVPRVLGVMRPFIEKGNLLPRTEQSLSENYKDYIVYELDEGIRACAAFYHYDEKEQAEIAAVAVDEIYSHMGIGPKLVSYLIERAKGENLESVFVMTTQTGDWFEKIGFELDSIESLPKARLKLWTKERGSKVYRLKLR